MAADTVTVLVQDLEQLHSILTSAHGAAQAHDIGASYRKLSNKFQWSPMTRAIENQMQIVQNYIDAAEEEKEDDAKS